MPNLWVVVFVSLFVAAAALIVIAGRRQRKEWLARADILRAFALRRGARADEPPADPSTLLPMRPFNEHGDLRRIELPVVVHGKTGDVDYRLFDVHTEHQSSTTARNRAPRSSYDTYVTITSSAAWPRFEFAAISDAAEDSLTGRMLGAAGTLAEYVKTGTLTHVPIAHRPGFQLYVADAARGEALGAALLALFEHNLGWSIASLNHTVALSKRPAAASGLATLMSAASLDAFLDEAVALEKKLREGVKA